MTHKRYPKRGERQRAVRSDSIRAQEAAFLPIRSVEQLAAIRQAIIDAGEPPQTASGVVGWLLVKNAGEHDDTSGPTRARYRKILAQIEGSPIIHDPATVGAAA